MWWFENNFYDFFLHLTLPTKAVYVVLFLWQLTDFHFKYLIGAKKFHFKRFYIYLIVFK